jgi:hypothetical protein
VSVVEIPPRHCIAQTEGRSKRSLTGCLAAASMSAWMSTTQSSGFATDRFHAAARMKSSNPAGLQMVNSSACSEVGRDQLGNEGGPDVAGGAGDKNAHNDSSK